MTIPSRDFFQRKPYREEGTVSESCQADEKQDIEEEYTDHVKTLVTVPAEEEYIEMVPKTKMVDHWVDETEVVPTKKTRSVKKVKQEERTRVVTDVVEKNVPKSGLWAGVKRFFGFESFDTMDDEVTREEKYTVDIPYAEEEEYWEDVPRIVKKNIPRQETEYVPEKRKKSTTTQVTKMEPVKRKRIVQRYVSGTRTILTQVIKEGHVTRGWEIGAKWSDPIWDKTKQNSLSNTFEPKRH
jgi:hypothetical protein